jgi:hypothetical protein
MMIEVIKVIASFVEFFAAIMFALSLFRIPLNYQKIAVTALIMAASGVYIREIPYLSQYASLSILTFAVIMVGLLFSLPFFYSLLVAILCFLAGLVLEYWICILMISLSIATPQLLQTNVWYYSVVMAIAAIILSLLTYIFQTKKIGFHFMTGHFSIKQSIKAYNFAIYAILVVSITLIQIISVSFNVYFQLHGIILVSVTILFLIGTYVVYKQNKKQITEKYERFNKNELH